MCNVHTCRRLTLYKVHICIPTLNTITLLTLWVAMVQIIVLIELFVATREPSSDPKDKSNHKDHCHSDQHERGKANSDVEHQLRHRESCEGAQMRETRSRWRRRSSRWGRRGADEGDGGTEGKKKEWECRMVKRMVRIHHLCSYLVPIMKNIHYNYNLIHLLFCKLSCSLRI